MKIVVLVRRRNFLRESLQPAHRPPVDLKELITVISPVEIIDVAEEKSARVPNLPVRLSEPVEDLFRYPHIVSVVFCGDP